ncbi:hypothetical protein N825_11610 [Skermanella stibiiresistens SB22]|uniref:BrnT family toxin n=1 Tax=Skermanella stibiiresistens SB22 TaxID=1385369 RepID=W9GU62_9PROT|nr:BrnT family toxin [Skermanella stibiiresistens]EWY37324.1 hypothetical protein N825_11610 [Skermanella stibiiresistens SB22]
MEFEWSEEMRLSTLEVRGIDFVDMQDLFDGRLVLTYDSPRGAEQRWITIGKIDGKFYAVVWTVRIDRIRIISARRARHGEEGRYRMLYD